MEKRTIIAFVLSFLVLIIWSMVFTQKQKPAPEKVQEELPKETTQAPPETVPRPEKSLPPAQIPKAVEAAPAVAPETHEKEIIVETLELDIEPEDIENNEMLFGSHLGIDSVSTLMLIEALEDAFDIEVEDEEISVDLFESVLSLSDYVQRKIC